MQRQSLSSWGRPPNVHRKTAGIWIAAALLYGIGIALVPAFRSPANLVEILRGSAFVGILAAGQTVVVILRGFDLSQTAVAPLAGLVAGWLVEFGHQSVWVAVGATIAIGLVAGGLNGAVVAYSVISGFITTLCSYFAFVGIGLFVHP